MTVVTLERLGQALHEIRQRCPDLPLLAIRWMHIKHPLHETQERLLQREGHAAWQVAAWRGRLTRVRRLGQCVVYACLVSVRLARMRWLVRRQMAMLARRPFDVLARTWCFGTERPHDDRDFYYGDLQQRLAQRNVQMLLLCGDVSGKVRGGFARGQVAVSPLARMPDLCLVHPLAPFHMMAKQLLTCWRLWRLRRKEADPLIRAILAFAGRDCLAPDTALTGLLFWVGRAAARTWGPKAVVTFYEGQAYESCLWRGVKAAQASCQTVGYQHTVLLRHNLALLGAEDRRAVVAQPDVVLCLGPETQAMLRPSHPRAKLVVFGTFRQLPDAAQRHAPRPQVRVALVVPESGLIPESQALFQFTLRAARALPDYRFLFRCHPIMPFARLRPLLPEPPEELPNLEVSQTASIADDFARSSVVLYRGSSSVLYAVLHGLKPVYVRLARCPDGDPLFELDGWRERASSVDELAQVLRRYAAVAAEDARRQWRDAARYVERYTTAVSEASVEALCSAVGLSSAGAPCGA